MVLVVTTAIGVSSVLADEPWKRHVIDAGSRGADGVRLADVDGDGRLDVVTPWEEGGDVRVAFDRGMSAARRWEIQSVGRERSVEDAVAVDLDEDGVMEVVACAEGKARAILVFSRDATLHTWSGADLGNSRGRQQYMFALPMSFENLGTALVVGAKNKSATLSLWRPEDGVRDDYSRWSEQPLTTVGWIMSIQAIDMNGDGIRDAVFSDRRGSSRGVWWFRGTPNGLAGPPVYVGGKDHEVMFLAAGDFDGDGDEDIAVAARPQNLLLYERLSADGLQWTERVLPLPNNAGLGKGVAIETRHGATEIFVSCGPLDKKPRLSIVRFTWNDSANVMTATPDRINAPGGTEGIKFDRMELVDLDGDGDRDLLTCEERANLGVVWYERP